MQRNTQDDLKKILQIEYFDRRVTNLKKVKHNKNIYFLIDSSGSMTNAHFGAKHIEKALQASYVTIRANQKTKNNNVVITALFGNNDKALSMCSSEAEVLDIQNFFVDSLKKQTSFGSKLINEIDSMSNMVELKGKNQEAELIIFTDGDLDSPKETKEKLINIQNKYPNMNINICVVRNRSHSAMKDLALSLKNDGVPVNFQKTENVDDIIQNIIHAVSNTKDDNYTEKVQLKEIHKMTSEISKDFNLLATKLDKLEKQVKEYSQSRKKTVQYKR